MDKRFSALDLDALRSFVEGIQSTSFAEAAYRLCRSTSAVSAQLKKLEQQCGVALTVKQGRTLALTREGEILLSYARRMLALNDEALRAMGGVAAGRGASGYAGGLWGVRDAAGYRRFSQTTP